MRQQANTSHKDAAWIIMGMMVFAVSWLGWIPSLRTPATLVGLSAVYALVTTGALTLAFFKVRKEV